MHGRDNNLTDAEILQQEDEPSPCLRWVFVALGVAFIGAACAGLAVS